MNGFEDVWRTGSSFPTARAAEYLKRETDLSTEQARAQAPSRFPRAHVNQGRAKNPLGTSRARPQAAVCLREQAAARTTCMERLRQRAEFLAAASGIKVPAAAFVLQACNRRDAEPARFGFIASKKVG